MLERPEPCDTKSVLGKLKGRFVILNVMAGGNRTSVCVNIRNNGSASWRKKNSGSNPLTIADPGFTLTNRSWILSYNCINVLCDNFFEIRKNFPQSATNQGRRVAMGTVGMDTPEMGQILGYLEGRTDAIDSIQKALELCLDTSIFKLRQNLQHHVALMKKESPTEYSQRVLTAFSESQKTYSKLPELTDFGIKNARGEDKPVQRAALLRWYMQRNESNPLNTNSNVDFVAYEMKPLNIAGLNWNCTANPRTDSIDLLLKYDNVPMFTEVKMRRDKFASSAIVQVLYYASILANKKQQSRICRELGLCKYDRPWISIVVEKRDNPIENGFEDDLEQSLSFLHHTETKRTLGKHLAGCAVFVIQETSGKGRGADSSPAFQLIENGSYFVRWD